MGHNAKEPQKQQDPAHADEINPPTATITHETSFFDFYRGFFHDLLPRINDPKHSFYDSTQSPVVQKLTPVDKFNFVLERLSEKFQHYYFDKQYLSHLQHNQRKKHGLPNMFNSKDKWYAPHIERPNDHVFSKDEVDEILKTMLHRNARELEGTSELPVNVDDPAKYLYDMYLKYEMTLSDPIKPLVIRDRHKTVRRSLANEKDEINTPLHEAYETAYSLKDKLSRLFHYAFTSLRSRAHLMEDSAQFLAQYSLERADELVKVLLAHNNLIEEAHDDNLKFARENSAYFVSPATMKSVIDDFVSRKADAAADAEHWSAEAMAAQLHMELTNATTTVTPAVLLDELIPLCPPQAPIRSLSDVISCLKSGNPSQKTLRQSLETALQPTLPDNEVDAIRRAVVSNIMAELAQYHAKIKYLCDQNKKTAGRHSYWQAIVDAPSNLLKPLVKRALLRAIDIDHENMHALTFYANTAWQGLDKSDFYLKADLYNLELDYLIDLLVQQIDEQHWWFHSRHYPHTWEHDYPAADTLTFNPEVINAKLMQIMLGVTVYGTVRQLTSLADLFASGKDAWQLCPARDVTQTSVAIWAEGLSPDIVAEKLSSFYKTRKDTDLGQYLGKYRLENPAPGMIWWHMVVYTTKIFEDAWAWYRPINKDRPATFTPDFYASSPSYQLALAIVHQLYLDTNDGQEPLTDSMITSACQGFITKGKLETLEEMMWTWREKYNCGTLAKDNEFGTKLLKVIYEGIDKFPHHTIADWYQPTDKMCCYGQARTGIAKAIRLRQGKAAEPSREATAPKRKHKRRP